MRFCAILSAKISLLPPRIARNGLISETGSLLTAPSSGESVANLFEPEDVGPAGPASRNMTGEIAVADAGLRLAGR